MNYSRNKNRGRKPRKKATSQIKPEWLVKKATKVKTTPFVPSHTFAQLNLHKALSKNIAQKGYVNPTEIQEKCIDQLLSGQNLVGVAATGTGKTAAFLIPIIEQIMQGGSVTGLVVVPTRELAMQVATEFKSLTKGLRLFVSCFIGGTNVNKDVSFARKHNDLIVGTPGRINDLIDRKALKLNHTHTLVLDEFDRMLDMGFVKDIQKIVATMSNRQQTMLFSATVAPDQEKLINEIVPHPVRVNVSTGTHSSDNVEQKIIRVAEDENKFDVLYDMVSEASFSKVILFAETKRTVDRLGKQLIKSGIKSDVIHGDKSQNYRTRAIDQFKRGKVKVLVATDVAARGIDVKGVTHVINYQLPQTMDSYIHRIGRTGRADAIGTAYTFVN